MGAAAVTATIIRRERELVRAFQGAGAISPETAVSLQALHAHRGIAFRRLRARAVVREGADDRYYLDLQSWEALRRMRRRTALAVAIVAIIVAVIYLSGMLTLTAPAAR